MSKFYLRPRGRLPDLGEKIVSLTMDIKNAEFMGHKESGLSN